MAATGTFTRATGNYLYGKVVLSASPGSTFSFHSMVGWPGRNHDDAVLEGILTVLREAGIDHELPARIVLQEVDFRPEESHWDAFYEAAKLAMTDLLQRAGLV